MIESLSSLGYFRFKSILSAFIVYDPVRVCSHEDITPKPKQIRRMTAGKNELSAVSPLDQFLVRSFIQNCPDLEKLIISQNFQVPLHYFQLSFSLHPISRTTRKMEEFSPPVIFSIIYFEG